MFQGGHRNILEMHLDRRDETRLSKSRLLIGFNLLIGCGIARFKRTVQRTPTPEIKILHTTDARSKYVVTRLDDIILFLTAVSVCALSNNLIQQF
jgi:hypothetical protein